MSPKRFKATGQYLYQTQSYQTSFSVFLAQRKYARIDKNIIIEPEYFGFGGKFSAYHQV